MRHPYLIGFVRNFSIIPPFGKRTLNLTSHGPNGVVWLESPTEQFAAKEDFLLAMLGFLESLRGTEISILPIQTGMRVNQETDILELLKRYEQELASAYQYLDGCHEYVLDLLLTDTSGETEDPSTGKGPDRADDKPFQGSGKQYFELVRLRQQRYQGHSSAAILLKHILFRLQPWFKDFRVERNAKIKNEISLVLLVHKAAAENFCLSLEHILSGEPGISGSWNGPWPPFHFIPFKLHPESFLVLERLTWP